jgi:hypothetical protein
MVECPTCGGDFHSDRSMRHHHSMSHKTRLDNAECSDCGKSFYSKSGSRKYCDNCLSFEGEKNPNYSGEKERSSCLICGSEFEYYPSEKPGCYCPECVEDEDWRDVPETLSGEENNQYNSIKTDCANCGDEIEVAESKLTDKNYCNMSCFAEHRSEFQIGEDNPNYKGGESSSDLYSGRWYEVKRKCRDRDNLTCQKCGNKSGTIDVHHITPVREFDDPNQSHTLDNVVCLCRSCHISIDHGDAVLPKDLSSSVQ